MTQVKICGITCEEDARAAVEAGASAIGLDFRSDSPRRVEPSRARAIVAAAGDAVERVGVFADEEAERVLSVMAGAGLDVAQLHGEEEPGYGAALGREWYRVFRIGDGSEPAAVCEQIQEHGREVFMLEARSENGTLGAGGGRERDWRLATKVAMRTSLSGGSRMILSGGLDPDNVAGAIRLVRPWRVDVCGGVETSPGRKDAAEMARFVAAVRGIR